MQLPLINERRSDPPFHMPPLMPRAAPPRRVDPPANDAQPPVPFGVAVLCLILVAQALRPGIVSIGPLLTDIIDDFGLAHTQASLLTAIPTLLMGLLALPTPWLARRFGRDRVIVAALLVLAATTLARAYASSTVALFATTAGVGAGIAIAGALVPGFVKAGFPRQVALLMGLYAMALSLGSTFAAGSTGLLAQIFGTWRLPAGLWAIPPLLGVAAWAYVASRNATSRNRGTGPRYPLPLGNRTAWLIAAYFAFNNVVFYSFISWLAPLYVELGQSAASAGLILACFTFAFLVATPLFGALSRNEDRRLFLALAAGTGAAGVFWMAIAPGFLPLVIVSLIAFGAGGSFTLSMTLPLDNARTDAEAASWNAFVLLVSYIVGAIGPVAVGLLRDWSGSFQPSLWLLAAISAAMLLLAPFLRPRQPATQG